MCAGVGGRLGRRLRSSGVVGSPATGRAEVGPVVSPGGCTGIPIRVGGLTPGCVTSPASAPGRRTPNAVLQAKHWMRTRAGMSGETRNRSFWPQPGQVAVNEAAEAEVRDMKACPHCTRTRLLAGWGAARGGAPKEIRMERRQARNRRAWALTAAWFLLTLWAFTVPLLAQPPDTSIPKAPPRAEGEGPFARLILRGATLIDGTGAPPMGPVDIVIEKNRIVDIVAVGSPGVAIDPEGRPKAGP